MAGPLQKLPRALALVQVAVVLHAISIAFIRVAWFGILWITWDREPDIAQTLWSVWTVVHVGVAVYDVLAIWMLLRATRNVVDRPLAIAVACAFVLPAAHELLVMTTSRYAAYLASWPPLEWMPWAFTPLGLVACAALGGRVNRALDAVAPRRVRGVLVTGLVLWALSLGFSIVMRQVVLDVDALLIIGVYAAVLGLPALAWQIWLWLELRRARRRLPALLLDRCLSCGYSLRDIPATRCPECGVEDVPRVGPRGKSRERPRRPAGFGDR